MILFTLRCVYFVLLNMTVSRWSLFRTISFRPIQHQIYHIYESNMYIKMLKKILKIISIGYPYLITVSITLSKLYAYNLIALFFYNVLVIY